MGRTWVVTSQAIERFWLIDPRYDGPPYEIRRYEVEQARESRTVHGGN